MLATAFARTSSEASAHTRRRRSSTLPPAGTTEIVGVSPLWAILVISFCSVVFLNITSVSMRAFLEVRDAYMRYMRYMETKFQKSDLPDDFSSFATANLILNLARAVLKSLKRPVFLRILSNLLLLKLNLQKSAKLFPINRVIPFEDCYALGCVEFPLSESAASCYLSRMTPLRSLLGPGPKEIWQQLCQETGGQFIDRGLEFDSSRSANLVGGPLFSFNFEARLPHRQWLIIHQHWPERSNEPLYYGINALFISLDGFCFSVDHHRLINLSAKLFDLPSVKTGFPDFDHRFTIKSNDEERTRQFFASAPLRELLTAQSNIHLEVQLCPDKLRKTVPAATHVLNCRCDDFTCDIEQTRQLLAIITTALDQLASISSAHEPRPKTKTAKSAR